MMPTIMPCASPVRRRSAEPGLSPTQKAWGRHFGDIYEAPSYLRIEGSWVSIKSPRPSVMATADLVLLGGHETEVDAGVTVELDAASLCYQVVSGAAPSALLPSTSLYPATSLYPSS